MHTFTRLAFAAILPFAVLAVAVPAQAATVSTPAANTKLITAKQVGQHSTRDNCWMVVNRGVYNVTTLVAQSGPMIGFNGAACGSDATDVFVAQYGPSTDALLFPFRVGVLKGKKPPKKPVKTPAVGTYSRGAVGLHGGFSDCWVIVGNGVYNISPLIATDDSAGAAANQSCAGDGTSAFTALYGAGVADTLAPYKVGVLG